MLPTFGIGKINDQCLRNFMASLTTSKKAHSTELRSVVDIAGDAELAPFTEDIAALLECQDEILHLRSYLLAQQALIAEKLGRIRTQHPAMPLKEVVARIMEDFPENISAEMLLLLTRFTIAAWEKGAGTENVVSQKN